MIYRSLNILLALLLTSTAACSVGPDYAKPSAPVATTFKEQAGWKASDPKDEIDRGAWWSIYKDPVLDALEKKVSIDNQTIESVGGGLSSGARPRRSGARRLFPHHRRHVLGHTLA